jgi:hypothetical protein
MVNGLLVETDSTVHPLHIEPASLSHHTKTPEEDKSSVTVIVLAIPDDVFVISNKKVTPLPIIYPLITSPLTDLLIFKDA